jgi:hypothetical protein
MQALALMQQSYAALGIDDAAHSIQQVIEYNQGIEAGRITLPAKTASPTNSTVAAPVGPLKMPSTPAAPASSAATVAPASDSAANAKTPAASTSKPVEPTAPATKTETSKASS